MQKAKRYITTLMLLLPFLALMSTSSTSCNPHRRGPTAKQLGAASGKKYHTHTASAKRKRKRKH